MGALTDDRPKPMVTVAGKTLLEHKFDALPPDIEDIVLVVGYRQEVIRAAYGEYYQGKRIRYVEQRNIVGGTADALWQAQPLLMGRFVVMMGDDLYGRDDIARMMAFEWALLAGDVSDMRSGGRVVIEGDTLVRVDEGESGAGLYNTNVFTLDMRIFNFPQVPKAPGSSELGLPQTVIAASRASGIPISVVRARTWMQITTPEDVEKASQSLMALL